MLLHRIVDKDVFSSMQDVQKLQQQLNRMLGAGASIANQEFPLVNVWTSKEGAILRAEIPGVNPEDVEITVVNDTLTIRGSRQQDMLNDDQTRHRQERGFGQFTRSLQLPFAINADNVEARFKNGVLQVTLPRAESERLRRINVISE